MKTRIDQDESRDKDKDESTDGPRWTKMKTRIRARIKTKMKTADYTDYENCSYNFHPFGTGLKDRLNTTVYTCVYHTHTVLRSYIHAYLNI